MSYPKTEFYWASVGGADPEPVEVVREGPVTKVFTFGCPDPFVLGDPDCPVVLGSRDRVVKGGKVFSVLDTDSALPMVRPSLSSKAAPAIRMAEAAWQNSGPHRWRGPR